MSRKKYYKIDWGDSFQRAKDALKSLPDLHGVDVMSGETITEENRVTIIAKVAAMSGKPYDTEIIATQVKGDTIGFISITTNHPFVTDMSEEELKKSLSMNLPGAKVLDWVDPIKNGDGAVALLKSPIKSASLEAGNIVEIKDEDEASDLNVEDEVIKILLHEEKYYINH